MLKIKNFFVEINKKTILENINLDIGPGEIHALLGSNGSGKSTLLNAIMGKPYSSITGSLFLDNNNITDLETYERSSLGIFLSFPP